MRCPKCGYSSFDHVDKCRKCGRDLREVRLELNLMEFQPEAPFLLGTLVGDAQGVAASDQQNLSLSQETELELSGLAAGESPVMDATVDMAGMRQTIDSDSLEDLELGNVPSSEFDTMRTQAAGGTDAADLSLDDLPGKGAGGLSLEREDQGFLGLELETDQGPSTFNKPAGVGKPSRPEFTSAGKDAQEITDLGRPGAREPEALASRDSVLELDLSEADLSALAEELETHLETGTEQKKKTSGMERLILEADDDQN